MSLLQPDSIVTGADDVKQCIGTILLTRKGEDPLRPHFGSRLFDWVDRPVNTAVPNMKKEMLEAIRLFEPRIKVKKITHRIEYEQVHFNIEYVAADGTLDFFDFVVGDQFNPDANGLHLLANYDPADYRYHITLILDSMPALPMPPAEGFASIPAMMTWIANSWYFYGSWQHTPGSNLVSLSVPAVLAQTGSLSIIGTQNALTANIPPLADLTDYYTIDFRNASGTLITPIPGTDIQTKGGILSFVQTYYGGYGTWSIQGNTLVLNGSVDLTGFTLTINTSIFITSSFTEGFSLGFES